MHSIGDIVRADIDVTGHARNVIGEVFSVTRTGWGDIRYDVISPDGAFRFTATHVTLDEAATVAAGLRALESFYSQTA